MLKSGMGPVFIVFVLQCIRYDLKTTHMFALYNTKSRQLLSKDNHIILAKSWKSGEFNILEKKNNYNYVSLS